MTNDAQETNLADAKFWLELANGGGVMLRDPSVVAPPKAEYQRYHQPKQLEAKTL